MIICDTFILFLDFTLKNYKFDFSWFILIGLILKFEKKKQITLVPSDKWIVTTDSFNKQFILRLRNHDLFNKIVFVSTYVVKYS